MNLILASSSPRRRELLTAVGLTFEVKSPEVDETIRRGESPVAYVRRVAAAKLQAVARARPEGAKKSVILAADTIVVIDKKILGKPASQAQAKRMLRTLSGRAHQVLTAIAIGTGACRKVEVVRTRVTFRQLTSREIGSYVRSGEPMDKAGAYGAQGRGMTLIAEIRGSYTNVVGLPVAETLVALRVAGLAC